MAKTRVLIVDDHPLMRRGLCDMLATEPDLEVCAEADDIGKAHEQVRKAKPQLVIIDVSLPSGSGLDLAKQIQALDGSIRMLFLSMHEDAVFAERALRAGALGYINKSRPGNELLDAIRKVAHGEIALSQPMIDRLVRRGVSTVRGPATGVESLSDRELEVFELIGRGLSARDIAERLSLSLKTVEAHREHIKTKLHLKTAAELSHRAILWSNSQS
jgi:DNA-binding NarL/FixJ family response regulator